MKELLDYIDIKITDRYQLRYAVLTLFQRKWASLDVCSNKKSIEKIHDRKLRISSFFFCFVSGTRKFLTVIKKSLNKSVQQE